MKTRIISILFSTSCCLLFGYCNDQRGNQIESVGPFFKGIVRIIIGNQNDDPNLIKATFNKIKNRIYYSDFSSDQLDNNTYQLTVKRAADTAILKKLLSESITIEFTELYNIGHLATFFSAIHKDLEKQQTPKISIDSNGTRVFVERAKTLTEIIRILQPVPDERNQRYFYPAALGNVRAKDTAYLNILLANEKYREFIPGSLKFVYGKYSGKSLPADSFLLSLYALRLNTEHPNPYPTGDQISDVKLLDEKDVATNMRVIAFQFNAAGARAWHYMTKKNVGWPIAISANEKVLTAPTVDGPIEDGSSRINGDFTELELWYILTIMRSGKLPLPVSIISSNFSASH